MKVFSTYCLLLNQILRVIYPYLWLFEQEFFANCLFEALYIIQCSTRNFFLGLFLSLRLLAGYKESFLGLGIGYSIERFVFGYDLLRRNLLVINIWWVFRAYTLRYFMIMKYFMILKYFMKIIFHVLWTSNLDHFLNGIYAWILILCLRFCPILLQAFLKIMIDLSVYFINNGFYKCFIVSIFLTENSVVDPLLMNKKSFIYANILYYYFAILFSSYIYNTVYLNLISLFW